MPEIKYTINVPESRKPEFEKAIKEFIAQTPQAPPQKKGPQPIDENCEYVENLTD